MTHDRMHSTDAGTARWYAYRASMPIERAAALAYAARGWHVIPIVPGGKAPAVPDWERRATCDASRIRGTWRLTAELGSSRAPACLPGVGIACGPSGLVVVDLDVPKPGQESPPQYRGRVATGEIKTGADVFTDLCRRHGQVVPVTLTVRTPRGGWHLYFTHPRVVDAGGELVRLRNTAGALGWLIDTRAHGGQVVAPPSVTRDGRYRVVRNAAVAPLPAWLADLLTPRPVPAGEPVTVSLRAADTRPAPPPRLPGLPATTADRSRAYVEAAISGELRRIATADVGQRNRSLFIAAVALGQLAAGGAIDATDVRALLRQAAAPHVAARAYTAREAEATIRSGLRAGARRPRRLAS